MKKMSRHLCSIHDKQNMNCLNTQIGLKLNKEGKAIEESDKL